MATPSDSDFPAIVMDCGSEMVKAGLASNSIPDVVFQTVLAFDHQFCAPLGKPYATLVGNQVIHSILRENYLAKNYPVENGIFISHDYMEHIWRHIFFNELKVDPEDHPILLTEAPLNPKYNREKSVEVFFEYLEVPSICLSQQPVLSLYRSGSTTGVVLDSGEGLTHSVPVYEGHALPYAMESLDLAGGGVSSFLSKTLTEKGVEYIPELKLKEGIREIKKKFCYVAQDYERELTTAAMTSSLEELYKLPDDQTVTIGLERFRAPEILFQPTINGLDDVGIHEKLYNSIMNCNADLQNDLFRNINLSGGTSMLPGFADRLKKEVTDLVPSSTNINFFAPLERDLSAWIGGSIFASHSSFQKLSISKKEYDEAGPSLVHRYCF